MTQWKSGWRTRIARSAPIALGYCETGGSSDSEDSVSCRPTNRVTMAKSRPTDKPHISTPLTLSKGPSIRHIGGGTRSP